MTTATPITGSDIIIAARCLYSGHIMTTATPMTGSDIIIAARRLK